MHILRLYSATVYISSVPVYPLRRRRAYKRDGQTDRQGDFIIPETGDINKFIFNIHYQYCL